MGDSGDGDDRDDGEPIVIRTYEDMLNRIDFVSKLNLVAEKLEEVKSEYHFEKECHCGIASCNTPHKWGLLVGLASGKEINIGNKCGQNHFPELFDKAHKRFTVRRDRRIREDIFAQFMAEVDELNAIADTVWGDEFGGLWAHECSKVTREHAPQCLLSLKTGIASGRTQLTVGKRLAEGTEGMGFKKGSVYEDVPVGNLRGARAFWNSPQDLIREVRATLDRSRTCNFKPLPPRTQKTFLNEHVKARTKLTEARDIVAAARLCFTRANLEQLHLIAKHDRDAIEAFIRRIESVPSCYARRAG